MRVKKYVVDSMSDALQQIRTDLGKDAIILNTKPIKTGGFLGMFRKKKIEVIAAIDPNESNERERKRVKPSPVSFSASAAPAIQEEKKQVAFSTVLQTAALQHESAAFPEEKANVPKELPSTISREVEEMKEMFWKLMLKDEGVSALPPSFAPLRKRLLEQEVTEEIIATVFEHVLKQVKAEKIADEKHVWKAAKEAIVSLLVERGGTHGALLETTVFANFVGPTGVGKTTTLAKLAAESMLQHNKKVGMITSDTYRIAAVEQLKTYANILNVPLKVVYSAEELVPTVERMNGCNMIFMDTAGRNYRNKEYVEQINKLLQSPLPNETFLVLSVTAKQSDLEAIIESFKEATIDKVIFTKIDETRTYGSILNLIVKHGLTLSYFTTGQNVPDDIEIATPEKVAALLLGEKEI
jgi:flagellar biosynthesis protein FlhF